MTLIKILLAATFNVSATTNYKGNNKKIIQVKKAVVNMKFTNLLKLSIQLFLCHIYRTYKNIVSSLCWSLKQGLCFKPKTNKRWVPEYCNWKFLFVTILKIFRLDHNFLHLISSFYFIKMYTPVVIKKTKNTQLSKILSFDADI